MLSLRNRFGIPGVISVIALVFAMLGGAYAASNNGGGKATASAKAKKGPRGPKGATGPAGPAGAQGPAGANGKDGSNGSNGSDGPKGATGASGTNGTSVTSAPSVSCGVAGGFDYTSASGTDTVCNGQAGSPWTAGGTLPPNATETGVWSFSGPRVKKLSAGESDYKADYGFFGALIPISFSIPIAAPLDAAHAVLVPSGGSNANCPGSASEPQANSGYLCVYESLPPEGLSSPLVVLPDVSGLGAGKSGALLKYSADASAVPPLGFGTWAVTG